MSMMKHIQTWLLMAVIAVGASVEVNAKTASGLQKLKSGLYVGANALQVVDVLKENYDVALRCTSGVRYVQSDPIGLSDGPSTYGYVHGNPVNDYDINGLASTAACANPVNFAACAAAGIIRGAAIGGATGGGINVGLQAYNKGWNCIDWDEAVGATYDGAILGAFLGLGEAYVLGRFALATPALVGTQSAVSTVNTTISRNSVGELRALGRKDAHHIIQDAAAKNLKGYKTNSAPGIQLEGPASSIGTPHYLATQIQRQAGGGTFAAERRIGYKALRKAGVPRLDARQYIQHVDDYFSGLGVSGSTPMRAVGNRKRGK